MRYGASEHDLYKLTSGFAAYFGSFTIDEAKRTVTHKLEGEYPPGAGRYEVTMSFRFAMDSLVFGTDSTIGWRFVRVK